MITVGFDTSNYTTSIAWFDGTTGKNESRLLPVKPGELGLRQSDAVFHHTKSLPELSGRLFSHIDPAQIKAVGVSTRPRSVEGSYMPCFMVGYSHAKMLAEALHVPLVERSHQDGHIAASAWSANAMHLLSQPHLAWHLSGGTTELLFVNPQESSISCEQIGGTSDISAGQLIDRTGLLLNQQFPAGKHLDALSQNATKRDFFKVKCSDAIFSFSGLQNKVTQYFEAGNTPEDTASYALRSIIYAVEQATKQAQKKYPDIPVVLSGGVASNSLLRELLAPLNPIFALPEFSTDNAMGIAVLTHRQMER